MFFKTIGKMRSDKRGFTITELLVTCAIMALIAALLALIMGPIWKKYRMVENLYIVQTEVKAIMNAYSADASQGSLATATNVDLMYEDSDYLIENKAFQSCPELGTFTEDENNHSLYFATRDSSNAAFDADCFQYTYLFVYDGHMYVLNGKQSTAYRFCFTDEIQVDIKYSVSVDAFGMDADGKESTHRLDNTEVTDHKYLVDGVTVTVASAPIYDFYYDLDTSFALKNAMNTQNNYVNLNNIDGTHFTNQYCAGYIYGTNLKTNEISGKEPDSFKKDGVTYSHLTDEATVIKYISIKNFNSGDISGASGSTGTNFNCSFSFLMVNSNVGEGVLNTLRSFRDNTLRGTAIGDRIIDVYYGVSPEVISFLSRHELFRNIAAEAVKGTAYVMELVG
ncbi:MAG: CFI-box-CTERM domain-containing protein [Clostridiaceae bacterium]|nr:CFI-box-CTERM domain-containing protein [Clostridiaceae bacterium]